MNFNAAVFGAIEQVAVYSATGDAIGYADVNGEQMSASFSSLTGAIGQLPELPIMVVTVPVNASAAAGTTAQITLDLSGTTWADPQHDTYQVTITPAQFTVGGSLSVGSITPGAGLLPGGKTLQITGTGFDGATMVTADGVALSGVQFISPQQMNVTLAGQTELTGKHFHIVKTNGEAVDYFAAPPSAPSTPNTLPPGFKPLTGVMPLIPLPSFTISSMNDIFFEVPQDSEALALLNPNTAAATITFQAVGMEPVLSLAQPEKLVIPPGTVYFLDATDLIASLGPPGELWIQASLPVRGLVYTTNVERMSPLGPTYDVQPFNSAASGQQVQFSYTANSASWSWQQGTALPVPVTINLLGNFPFQASISPPSGWLSATPGSSTTGLEKLILSVNPLSLAPGNYSATVTVTPAIPPSLAGWTALPITIPVSLTVSAIPLLSTQPTYDGYFSVSPGGTANTQLMVLSNGIPAAFTASANTNSGGNWLAVSPASGETPADVMVTANAGQLAPGNYSGTVTLTNPNNKLVVPFDLVVQGLPSQAVFEPYQPPPLSFVLESGTTGSASVSEQVLFTPLGASIAVSVTTFLGGQWLTAKIISNAPAQAAISVNANAAALQAGTYQGIVTVRSQNPSGFATLSATLNVLPVPTAQSKITVTPAALSLPGGGEAQFTVTSGATPVLITASSSMPSIVMPTLQALYCSENANPQAIQCATPATVDVATASNLQPGIYNTNIAIQWDVGSTEVPVTVLASPSSVANPGSAVALQLSSVVNAASLAPAALAPGELISVFGTGFGTAPAGPQVGANGNLATTLNAVQLLVNGTAAPLIYSSPNQLNAIVTFETGITGVASIQVTVAGQPTAEWQVPLAPAAAAIFTDAASGIGQARPF